MNKKIFSALVFMCLTVLGLVGCKHEELNTNQLSDSQVKLVGIAPNPVARGGALRLMGSNLQNVQQVEIPGVEPITEIEVIASGKVSEIRVIVPVDGPEVGPVSIIAGDTKLTTKTNLEYSEPIVFDGFSPASAMPGDVVTVKGDYMNNIRQITFEGGTVVNEFESQSRYELKVKVPSTAITGKIILGDVDESNNPDGKVSNLFYSETVLTIGAPTVQSADRGVIKSGSTVTVSGKYLDMIQIVKFGAIEADYTVAEDGKSLVTTVPSTAVDAEIALISYAGKEFKAGSYQTLVPSALSVAADSRYKAGLSAKVSGKDLDLVTGAALAGTALDFSYSEGVITFTIPAAAADGAITLSLANGKSVDTEAIELVKPVITAVSPASLYAGDENIKVTGTDLDLVVSATLGGKPINIAEGASDTALELVTELTSVSGKVALTLENGVTVTSEADVQVNYHSLVIVSEMPAAQHIGEEVILKGSNFDLVENIFIGDVKVTKYSLRTAEEVRFLMPWAKAGSYSMSFHLFNGDIETVATPIEVQLERVINTIWEGESYVTWSGGAVTNLSWGGYDWSTVKAGTSLVVNIEVVDDNAVIRLGNGSWAALPTTKTYPNADGDGNLAVGKDITAVSVVLTDADLNELVNNGGLVVCGTGYKAYSIQLITEIPQEKTIFEGPVALTWGDDGRFGLATSYFENLPAGSKMIIYFTQTEAWGQAQINDGWWKDTGFNFPELGGAYLNTNTLNDKSANKIELTLTQEILDHMKEVVGDYWGVNNDYRGDGRVAIVIQGSDWIIDRIAVK